MWEKTKSGNLVPKPEPNWKKNGVLKMKNFMFDHKGVQIPELNFKGKKKKVLLLQIIRFTGKKLVRIPSLKFNTPHSDILYEKKELNYLGTQLG